jgi:RHS repeat-associated protein
LLGAAAAVAATYHYTPYGTVTAAGPASTPLLFTGQYTDAESGLVYLRARYYDPATAEFLTLDPQVDQTGTPYAYVSDNPLNGTDLNGRCEFWCWVGIGAVAVGVAACIIAEPCGIAGGGLALGTGGLALAGGATFVGADAFVVGAVVGGLLGGLSYAVSSSTGDGHMIGENGTQTTSSTTWQDGAYRIDVENPSPGVRPGQMHFQDQSGQISKCQYNFDTGEFDGLPNSVAKRLAKNPGFQRGIQKGLKILGE